MMLIIQEQTAANIDQHAHVKNKPPLWLVEFLHMKFF